MISTLGRQANPSVIEHRCPNCRPVAIFEYDPISRASSSASPESPANRSNLEFQLNYIWTEIKIY